MDARCKSGLYLSMLGFLAWCLLPAPAFAQLLRATADGLVDVGGVNSISAEAESGRCVGVDNPIVGCPGIILGIATVIDTMAVTNNRLPPGDACAPASETILFSWFSVTQLPGGTLFPKIFSGGNSGSNMWQTTFLVEVAPGIVRIQDVCFATDEPPTLGRINFFDALAWSADLTFLASTMPLEFASLKSSMSLGPDGDWEVRLQSIVDEPRPGAFQYDYVFENLSPATVTISWDSANLTRTLEPYESVTVTEFSGFGALESQGYARVTDLDGEPIADMVSMALVPMQRSSADRGGRISGKTKSRADRRR